MIEEFERIVRANQSNDQARLRAASSMGDSVAVEHLLGLYRSLHGTTPLGVSRSSLDALDDSTTIEDNVADYQNVNAYLP